MGSTQILILALASLVYFRCLARSTFFSSCLISRALPLHGGPFHPVTFGLSIHERGYEYIVKQKFK